MTGHFFDGLKTFFTAIVIIAVGRGLDWFIKRRAEKTDITTKERSAKLAEEEAEDEREDSASTRYRQLWLDEQARADRITVEHNAMATDLTKKIEQLGQEVAAMKVIVGEKDSLIARQTAKIEQLEKRVRELERHERAAHKERPEP